MHSLQLHPWSVNVVYLFVCCYVGQRVRLRRFAEEYGPLTETLAGRAGGILQRGLGALEKLRFACSWVDSVSSA